MFFAKVSLWFFLLLECTFNGSNLAGDELYNRAQNNFSNFGLKTRTMNVGKN